MVKVEVSGGEREGGEGGKGAIDGRFFVEETRTEPRYDCGTRAASSVALSKAGPWSRSRS